MSIRVPNQILPKQNEKGEYVLNLDDIVALNSALTTLTAISPLLNAYLGHNVPKVGGETTSKLLIEGMLAYADGSNWDPLSKGLKELFIYDGSAWDEVCHPRVKVGSLTRAMDAATADVAYTGVGFTPRAGVFFGAVPTTGAMSAGVSTQTTHGAIYGKGAVTGTYGALATHAIVLEEGAGKWQGATVKSWDTDGFTLAWTRTGATASATATVVYLVIR